MKHIPIPDQKELRRLFVYNKETGELIRKITVNGKSKAGESTRYQDKNGYLTVCINYQSYRVHRVIYKWYHGKFDESKQIDHIDRNTSNNRIDNLRLVTTRFNSRNRKTFSNNTSGSPGVHFHKTSGLWRARISTRNKRLELGSFTNKQDAINARKREELRLGYINQ